MSSLRLHLWIAEGEFSTSVANASWKPVITVSHSDPKRSVSTSPDSVSFSGTLVTGPFWNQYVRLSVKDASLTAADVSLQLFNSSSATPAAVLGTAVIPFGKLQRGAPVGFKKFTFYDEHKQMIGLVRLRAQLQYPQSVVIPPTSTSLQSLGHFRHCNNHPEILLGLTGLAGFKKKDTLRFKVSCGKDVVRLENSVVAGDVQIQIDDPTAFTCKTASFPIPSSLGDDMKLHDDASRRALLFESDWQHYFWVVAETDRLEISVKRKNIFGGYERIGTVAVHLVNQGREYAAETVTWREVLSPSNKVLGRMRLSIQTQFPQSVIIPPGSSTKQVRKHMTRLLMTERDLAELTPVQKRATKQQIVSLRCTLSRSQSHTGIVQNAERDAADRSSGGSTGSHGSSSSHDSSRSRKGSGSSGGGGSKEDCAPPAAPLSPAVANAASSNSSSKKKKTRLAQQEPPLDLGDAARDLCLMSVGEAFDDLEHQENSHWESEFSEHARRRRPQPKWNVYTAEDYVSDSGSGQPGASSMSDVGL